MGGFTIARSICKVEFARRCGRGGGGRLMIPKGDNFSAEKGSGGCAAEGRPGKRVEIADFCIKEAAREGGLCCQPLDHVEGEEKDEASSKSNSASEETVIGDKDKSGGNHDDLTFASISAISVTDIIRFGL